MKQFVKPDSDCKLCHGIGEVLDSVDYGDTKVSMPTFCDCVEMQVADYEDIDIVLVLDDTDMYRITIDILFAEYSHAEYHYFFGTREEAKSYANSYLSTIWGEGETIYVDSEDYYMDNERVKAAQFSGVEVYDRVPAMSAKGAFHFQPIGWRIK